jgi:hypothetical protein
MRTVLGGLTQIQIARAAAPDLVEWTTTIARPDIRADRRRRAFAAALEGGFIDPSSEVGPLADVRRAEAEERARARAGWAAMLGGR